MRLDLWLLGVVGVFALIGGFSGALKQLSQWGGLALAYFLGTRLAAAMGPSAPALLPLPPIAAQVGLRVLVVLGVYVAASLALRFLFARLLPSGALTRADRAAGVAMGGLKAALVIWLMLSIVVAFDRPLAKAGWDLDRQAPGSRALALTRRHSLMDAVNWPALEGAKKLAAAQGDPDVAAELLKTPALKAALEDPKLKAALSDPALQEALRSMDPAALLDDPKIKALLEDPELAEKLGAVGE